MVDGIDECGLDDQDEIIEDLLSIKGPVPGACKLLLSSRKHPSISRWLHSKPVVRLDDNTDNVNSTISSFIHPRLQKLRDRFSPAIVDDLGDLLLARANGYFPLPVQYPLLTRFRNVSLDKTGDVHFSRSAF